MCIHLIKPIIDNYQAKCNNNVMEKKRKHPKHHKLVKALVKYKGDKKKAYAEAYPNASKTTVNGNAHNLFKKHPAIVDQAEIALKIALHNKGITPDKIASEINEIIKSGGKEIIHPRTGEVVKLESDDIKLKAVREAKDIMVGNARQEVNSLSLTQININEATTDKLDGILSKLDAVSSKLGITDGYQDGEIVDVEGERAD